MKRGLWVVGLGVLLAPGCGVLREHRQMRRMQASGEVPRTGQMIKQSWNENKFNQSSVLPWAGGPGSVLPMNNP